MKFIASPADPGSPPDGAVVWHGERVAHAIEMYFDDQADAAVRRLWLLPAGYQPITATVTSAGVKDTATGAITSLTA
jgi:hypothetical protein